MASLDGFVKIDQIDGEATEGDHQGWIKFETFSTGITNNSSITRTGTEGLGEGNSDFTDFSFVSIMSKASPLLAKACATGKHIPTVQVELMRSAGDGGKVKYMEYKFTSCFISSYNTNGGPDFPTDAVSVAFEEVEWTYMIQKSPDGSGGGNVSGKYSVKEGKSA